MQSFNEFSYLFISRSQHFLAGDEPDPKSCCGVTVSQTVSIRWFIVMIAFVGICCSIVGTVLGAMKASGREHLTVSLLMIGKDSHKAFLNSYYVGSNVCFLLSIGFTKPLEIIVNSLFCVCSFLRISMQLVTFGWIIP